VAVGGEELPRASRETPTWGDDPHGGHTSHWLLSPSSDGGSSDGAAGGGRLAWQGAAILRHAGKGAARRGLEEPETCSPASRSELNACK